MRTSIHRIMLHENLGEAHRKHAYQIIANELKIGHVKVTLLCGKLVEIICDEEGNETERICHYELGVSALCAL